MPCPWLLIPKNKQTNEKGEQTFHTEVTQLQPQYLIPRILTLVNKKHKEMYSSVTSYGEVVALGS